MTAEEANDHGDGHRRAHHHGDGNGHGQRAEARRQVAAVPTRDWQRIRHRLRLRPSRQPPSGIGPPRFELVIDLPSALIVVDRAMVAAWGRPRAERQRHALEGAARSLARVHTAEVGAGPAGGGHVCLLVGGVGTSALMLDPAAVAGLVPPSIETWPPAWGWLASSPTDQLVTLAFVARSNPHGLLHMEQRLQSVTARLTANGQGRPPIIRCWAGNRLAIFDHGGT